ALVVARALQGVAGALLVPSSLAVIIHTFPESERGKAIGSWTAWGAIPRVLGPPVAGGRRDPRRPPASDRRDRAARMLPCPRGPGRGPDAPTRAVPPPELLRREHRDVLDVCGPVDPVLVADPVSSADRC